MLAWFFKIVEVNVQPALSRLLLEYFSILFVGLPSKRRKSWTASVSFSWAELCGRKICIKHP